MAMPPYHCVVAKPPCVTINVMNTVSMVAEMAEGLEKVEDEAFARESEEDSEERPIK